MTVPKSKRNKSRFEVFHNMQAVQKELILYLMDDFGITRNTNLGEAQFLDLKFERVINLCAERRSFCLQKKRRNYEQSKH